MGRRLAADAIGIDFGTTTTLVSRRVGARSPETVPIGVGTGAWLPSIVGVDERDRVVVGEAAEELHLRRQHRSVKTSITRNRSDVRIDDREYPVDELVASVMTEAVRRAERAGLDPSSATLHLGCPAMWDGAQRRRLLGVARSTGLELEIGQIIDEPIAAGVAWIEDQVLAGERLADSRVLVFDPGGGTLDIAALLVREHPDARAGYEIDVLSAGGLDLAGDEIDATLAHFLRGTIDDPDLPDDLLAAALLDTARTMKETLSIEEHAKRPLGYGSAQAVELARHELDEEIRPQVVKSRKITEAIARGSLIRDRATLVDEDGSGELGTSLSPTEIRGIRWDEVAAKFDHVVLVGGTSRIPALRSALGGAFRRARVHAVASPQEAIARGLAIADRFERLNLHRPALDFDVEFYDHEGQSIERRRVYDAYTPLYQPFEASLDSSLSYSAHQRTPHRAYSAVLRCTGADGRPLRFAAEGTEFPGIRDHTRPGQQLIVRLYADGRIVFGTRELRVLSWPSIRGPVQPVRVRRVERPGDAGAIDEWRWAH